MGSSGATAAINLVVTEARGLVNLIALFSGIRARVIGWIHGFAAQIFYEKAFSALSESIFEHHKNAVDVVLAERASAAIEKIPAIYTRLAEGDAEAVSQALNSCRRLIDSFADAVYPAREGAVIVGDTPLQVGPQNVKNRINAYVAERVTSASRRAKLRQTLSNLYDRLSTGVHDEVTPTEARSLFLETYLLMGEILTLGPVPAVPLAPASPANLSDPTAAAPAPSEAPATTSGA
jgi:hypothetical protein